jgi:predicted MFS family arabinose efflux permease
MALALAGAAVSPTLAVAVPLVIACAAANGVALVCMSLLIQQAVGDELRGRVYAVFGSAMQLALVVGMVTAGPLTDRLGSRPVWLMAAATLAVATLVARRVRERGCGERAASI